MRCRATRRARACRPTCGRHNRASRTAPAATASTGRPRTSSACAARSSASAWRTGDRCRLGRLAPATLAAAAARITAALAFEQPIAVGWQLAAVRHAHLASDELIAMHALASPRVALDGLGIGEHLTVADRAPAEGELELVELQVVHRRQGTAADLRRPARDPLSRSSGGRRAVAAGGAG